MRLIRAKHGPKGALRRYQHDRLGIVEVITTYTASADILYVGHFKARPRPAAIKKAKRKKSASCPPTSGTRQRLTAHH